MESGEFSDPHAQRALRSLHGWAMEHRDDWPTEEPFERVFRATMADATKTFGAIALQTEQGYGSTGLKHARSLFESVVVAYWMTYCADHNWVITRVGEHLEMSRRALADAVKEHPDWWEAVGAPELAELENEDRLVVLYGRFAQESWWANEVEQKKNGSGR